VEKSTPPFYLEDIFYHAMTKISLILIVFALLSANAYPKQKSDKPIQLLTNQSKTSYAIGVEVSRNFKRLGIDLDLNTLIMGIRDSHGGKPLLLSEEELRKTMESHYAELKHKAAESTKTLAEKNTQAGNEYRAKYKDMPGVTTLPSGVQYKIIKSGAGNQPTDSDSVDIHYRGAVANDAEFENTYTRGKPLTVEIKNLIPGLRDALKLMPAGSQWQIVVPPELAYGQTGGGRQLGPNATLVFDVELVGVKPGKEAKSKSVERSAEPPSYSISNLP
jgi:FKBP-type peptidyl-prolyl cis-trans isomerase